MKNTWGRVSVFFSLGKLAIISSILTYKFPTHEFDSVLSVIAILWLLSFGDIIIKLYKYD